VSLPRLIRGKKGQRAGPPTAQRAGRARLRRGRSPGGCVSLLRSPRPPTREAEVDAEPSGMTVEEMIAAGTLVLPTLAAAMIAVILKKLSDELSEFLGEDPDALDAG
jgi:hypothetical protein